MATGVNGSPLASAAQHVGPGHSNGGGGVDVLCLDQGATAALATELRQETATITIV